MPVPTPTAPAAPHPHPRTCSLRLTLPDGWVDGAQPGAGTRQVYDALDGELVLRQTHHVAGREPCFDLYRATVSLATTYRLDPWPVYDELARLYGTRHGTAPGAEYGARGGVPVHHLPALAAQIERQIAANSASGGGSA